LGASGAITRLDGFYLTEGNFTVADGTNNQLTINGSVVVDADLDNDGNLTVERTLATGDNRPSVVFSFDPGLVFRMPAELQKKRFRYKQLLP